MKSKLSEFLPPILVKKITARKWRFAGDYDSWEKAKEDSSGYEAHSVIEGIEQKYKEWLTSRETEKTKEHPILLDITDKTMLSAIVPVMMYIRKNDIRVLDLGGSLGGHYIVVRDILPKWINIQWDIVETTATVILAKKSYTKPELQWYGSLDEIKSKEYDIIFSSGTLQYLPNPEEALDLISRIPHRYLIINRFPIIDFHRDRLTIQNVPKSYYSGNYPAWFFSSSKWLNIFSKYYTTLYHWYIEHHDVYLSKLTAKYSGYVFEKK